MSIRPFQNLSEHYFYADEKKTVCEIIKTENRSYGEFAKDHKLTKSRIGKWMKKYNHWKSTGIDKFYDDNSGRPSKIDYQSSVSLCKFLKDRRNAQNVAGLVEVKQFIATEVRATAVRRGIGNESGVIDNKIFTT